MEISSGPNISFMLGGLLKPGTSCLWCKYWMRWEKPKTDQLSDIKGPKPLKEGWYVVTIICWLWVRGEGEGEDEGEEKGVVVVVEVGGVVGMCWGKSPNKSRLSRMATLRNSLESNSRGYPLSKNCLALMMP